MKEITHDINHDLTFYCTHTINCVCHSIRSMFRVLGIYNFVLPFKTWQLNCTCPCSRLQSWFLYNRFHCTIQIIDWHFFWFSPVHLRLFESNDLEQDLSSVLELDEDLHNGVKNFLKLHLGIEYIQNLSPNKSVIHVWKLTKGSWDRVQFERNFVSRTIIGHAKFSKATLTYWLI